MLEKLQTFPAQRTLWITTIVGLVAFIILNIVMYPYSAATATANAPSVIDFELTWGGARAQEIATIWWLRGVHDAQFILNLIDFAYMPAYAFFIGGAVLLVTRKIPEGFLKRLGFAAAVMPFGAWFCDVVENFNLLQVLLGNFDDYIAITASVAATIKFGLLFIAIGVFIGGLLQLLILRVKRRTPRVEQNITLAEK